MELRRALLLFAIVLGFAAIATSLSRPDESADEEDSRPPVARRETPTAGPRRTASQPDLVSFSTSLAPRTLSLAVNRPGVVTVELAQPGEVELAGLGLTAVAGPLTPARFDVLESQPGRYKVRIMPAGDSEARTVGTLEITESRRASGP